MDTAARYRVVQIHGVQQIRWTMWYHVAMVVGMVIATSVQRIGRATHLVVTEQE